MSKRAGEESAGTALGGQDTEEQETVVRRRNAFGNSLFALRPCWELMVFGIFSMATVHIYSTGLAFSESQTFGSDPIRRALLWFGCEPGTKRPCLLLEFK